MMTSRHNHLQEQYEDALFALMMDDYLREIGQQALEENERLKQSQEFEISEAMDRKIRKQIGRLYYANKVKRGGKSIAKIAKRVGIVVCAAVMLTMTAFAVFPEFKINVMNLWLEITDEYADFHFFSEDDSTKETVVSHDFVVTWVPEGFALESTTTLEFSTEYKYTSLDDRYIYIMKYVGDAMTLSIDTEDAEVENMQIHGMDALLTKKEIQTGTGQNQQEITLTWWDEQEAMILRVIAVEISESEVIKIAEGIQ
ncbi:MAG: DUF4367 domain-containing protein [Eubacteriales bacterium]|nr:DUF4367 domain-containing protein [Eubacteriales bacterium]